MKLKYMRCYLKFSIHKCETTSILKISWVKLKIGVIKKKRQLNVPEMRGLVGEESVMLIDSSLDYFFVYTF